MTILHKTRRKRTRGRIRIALAAFALGVVTTQCANLLAYKGAYRVLPEDFHAAVEEQAEFKLALVILGDKYDPELKAPERKPKQ